MCVEPSDNVYLLKDSLDLIELIALDFHNFDDGRGYSQAHLLNRWGYSGEIIGINAHLDQLQFMIRSGVTSYRLQEQYKEYDESDYADGFSICYQSAANNSGLKEVEFIILKPSFLKISIIIFIIKASPFFEAFMILGK